MQYIAEAFELVKVYILPVMGISMFLAIGLTFASGISAGEWLDLLKEPLSDVETIGELLLALLFTLFLLIITPPVATVFFFRFVLNIKIISRKENENENCNSRR